MAAVDPVKGPLRGAEPEAELAAGPAAGDSSFPAAWRLPVRLPGRPQAGKAGPPVPRPSPAVPGEGVAASEYERLSGSVEGLAAAIAELMPSGSAAERASAMEFVLEGLHLNKRLNKDEVAGQVHYRG